jgi:hypothetical protein
VVSGSNGSNAVWPNGTARLFVIFLLSREQLGLAESLELRPFENNQPLVHLKAKPEFAREVVDGSDLFHGGPWDVRHRHGKFTG